MKSQVIEDDQVWGEERAEGAVHGVVHSGLGHGPEGDTGVEEADDVPGQDCGVAERFS